MRRFYSPAISDPPSSIELERDETRHLRDVLRLREGDVVAVFDGNGREFSARIERITKNAAEMSVLSEIAPAAPESPLELTLAVALLKSDKFDLVTQKAVELGVSRIIPLVTKRGDVKPKDTEKRVDRWRRIALEATKQCGRARLTEILEPIGFSQFCSASAGGPVLLFSERGGSPLEEFTPREAVTAVTGPEGGWDDEELEIARSSGFRIVTLGGRILRAETAAIAIASILEHRFGDVR